MRHPRFCALHTSAVRGCRPSACFRGRLCGPRVLFCITHCIVLNFMVTVKLCCLNFVFVCLRWSLKRGERLLSRCASTRNLSLLCLSRSASACVVRCSGGFGVQPLFVSGSSMPSRLSTSPLFSRIEFFGGGGGFTAACLVKIPSACSLLFQCLVKLFILVWMVCANYCYYWYSSYCYSLIYGLGPTTLSN